MRAEAVHPDETAGSLATRRLADGGGPALEWIEGGPRAGPPLLFVHGAFGAAWSWTEHFLPFFMRRGRHVAAFSLRGHGGSEGHEALREVSLADLVTDLRRAIAALPEPPVVIGHSLGGLVAQRLLGVVPMRGLVLVSSLPPDGLALIGPRLALTDPVILAEGLFGSLAKRRAPVADAHWRLLFSEGLPAERAAAYAARMTPESPRALAEAHLPGPIAPAVLVGVPALAIGGTADRLVWPVSVARTALYHGARARTFAGMGHFLMLDQGAEEAARAILDWLEERGL